MYQASAFKYYKIRVIFLYKPQYVSPNTATFSAA